LERIIRRAGLTPWPKLFQNLRSTRETELAQHHPIHVVCAWLGNSPAVATKHYLQVRDEDFERAARTVTGDAESDAPSDAEATQNATQPASAGVRQDASKTLSSRDLCPPLANGGELWEEYQVPPEGLEPSTF
jgi:hypothetical protein